MILQRRKINTPAVINLKEANMKGGNSVTAILFNKYVDPHITYIEKKARIMSKVLEDLGIKY